jgi:DNA-directed RNA polymerase specialized sigma24 family protein
MTAPATVDLLGALPHLRRYARVLTGDARQADELLVDTVELAREAFPRQKSHVPLRTRLFGMMHQLYDAGWAKTPRSRATGAIALLAEFERLPVAEREVLLLVAVEGMSYPEIASVLDVPVATVVGRVSRARELLRGTNRGY